MPRPGDIIFFDWESDGTSDHVGFVESVADGKVNTIEGNSGDLCYRLSYDLDSVRFMSMVYRRTAKFIPGVLKNAVSGGKLRLFLGTA